MLIILLWRFGSSKTGSVANIRSEKVGIGTDNPLYKLDVSGTGRFTSSLITPKVDFGNGFTIEPSGTELVFKYNGVIKQRMLSDGNNFSHRWSNSISNKLIFKI